MTVTINLNILSCYLYTFFDVWFFRQITATHSTINTHYIIYSVIFYLFAKSMLKKNLVTFN